MDNIKPYTDMAADLNSNVAGDASDNYYPSTAGCCDSSYIPAGDPEISWPRHAADSTPSNHYSMLLTIEEGFWLGKLGYTSDSSQVHLLWPLISR